MNRTDIKAAVLNLLEIKPRGEFNDWLDLGSPQELLFELREAYRFPVFSVSTDLTDTGSYDFVTSFQFIGKTEKPYQALAKLRKIVRPDGELVVGFLNPKHYSKWFKSKSTCLTKNDLNLLLEAAAFRVHFIQGGRWIFAYAAPRVGKTTLAL